MTGREEYLIFWRRIFMCWWGGCGGTIDHDGSVYFKCKTCGRITR
jgi:tRNA(Ile2) C34 agmatinyltransferase TiaS